jgi:hypothetical protein
MSEEAWDGRGGNLLSVRSLLASKGAGRIKIRDVVFSGSSLRICAFRAKVRSFFISRSMLIDASSAKLRGDRFVVQDTPMASLPPDAFEFANQGWIFDRNETRMGDVLDIIIDDRLRIVEFVVKLGHQLIMPDDTMGLLSKKAKKAFLREIPDAVGMGKDAFTIVSLPADKVSAVRPDPVYYEVMTRISVEDLTNPVLRALQAGRSEKGLVRELFEQALRRGG